MIEAQCNYNIIDKINDIYYFVDNNGTLKKISKSVKNILGYEPEELIGKSVYDLYVIPAQRDQFLKNIDVKNNYFEIATLLKHKNGKHVSVYTKSHYVKDKYGNIIGIEGIVRDMSNFHNLKNSLDINQKIYKTIFENSPSGIIYFNTDGLIIEANSAALKILGTSKEELIGFNILKRVTNKNLLKSINLSLQNKEAIYKGPYTSVLSGKKLYLDIFLKPLVNDKNEIDFIVIFIDDKTKEYEINKNLVKAKNEWKSIIDNMVNIFIQTDKGGKIIKASPSVKDVLGYEVDEITGKYVVNFWQDEQKAKKIREEYIKNKEPMKKIIDYFQHKNGSRLSLEFYITPRFDEQGNYIGSDNIARDITEQIKYQKTLELYENVIKNSSEGILISDKDNKIVFVNKAFCDITRYKEEDVIGKYPSILKSGIHTKRFYKDMWDSINSSGKWKGEIWNKHKDDGIYPELLSINTLKNSDGEIENYIAIFTDISEIKKSEAKMRSMAMHDSLTGLPNRTMMSNLISHSIKSAKRQNELLGVMFIDLDNFKNINDNYGHKEGDIVLIETAKRLKGILREEDIVYRFGGDEFIVTIEHIKNSENLAKIAQKINRSIQIPYQTKSYTFYISCSIGIAIYPNDASTPDELIKNADAAMYQAKNRGKNRYLFYSHELGKEIQEELHIENLLRKSIEKNEFEIYYQPKIDTKTLQIVGLEALIRWNGSEKEAIAPDKFIPIAEKTGLIIPLGNWVLLQACKQIKKWHENKLYSGNISVNISGVQLENKNLISSIRHVINKSKLSPKYLDLEVTESVLMNDAKHWSNTLDQIRDLGIDISIDDFGTGYSSLSYLRELPVDELKIDKSFIDDIPGDKDACAIVKSIISLAKTLSYKTVAEGVEKKEQQIYLEDNGCDIIQGYYYSKPLSAKDMEDFLSSWCPKQDSNLRPLD